MIGSLVAGSSGPRSSPGWKCCVLFLDKDTYPSSAFLHPGIQVGAGILNTGSNTAMD